MAKISDYPSYSDIKPEDLLLVVAYPNEDPASKKVTVGDFFSHMPSASINGNFSSNGDITFTGNNYNVTTTHVTYTNLNVTNFKITSDGFIISQKFTPGNSSDFVDGSEGKISFDDNYLYVKTANNVTKRVALNSF